LAKKVGFSTSEWGYYCLGLVNHLKLKVLDVLKSSHPEIEMHLVTIGGAKVVHDVGFL
jgi:hypothetical protein